MKLEINLFDTKSIDAAISALESYKKSYAANVKTLQSRLADECASFAQANLDMCWYDDYVDIGEDTYAFSARKLSSIFYVEEVEGKYVVIGTGDYSPYDGSTNLVWVEFGAGMHYNLSVGSSPHPWGNTMPLGIGDYGYGGGKHHAWAAPYGLSRGTKAQMPMYNACIQTEDIVEEVAKEIFR